MLRSINESVVPGWGNTRVSGRAIHVILLSWWHLKTKGSVRPPTLSDLSPLKVKGFGLSHEDEVIVKQSVGRSTNHAVSYIPPNNGQSTLLQGLNVKKWVWQLNWFWLTEMSVGQQANSRWCQIHPCSLTLTLKTVIHHESVMFCTLQYLCESVKVGDFQNISGR